MDLSPILRRRPQDASDPAGRGLDAPMAAPEVVRYGHRGHGPVGGGVLTGAQAWMSWCSGGLWASGHGGEHSGELIVSVEPEGEVEQLVVADRFACVVLERFCRDVPLLDVDAA